VLESRKFDDQVDEAARTVCHAAMLFWLKKALTIPLMPLYFALICGAAGVLLSFRKRTQAAGRALMVVSILALATFSNKGVAHALLSPLEQQFPPIPDAHRSTDLPTDLQRCTAIVVLGGGHGDAPSLSRVNQLVPGALSRVAEAVRLSRLLPHAKVVTSGNHRPHLSHARVLAEAAISLGVDPNRIVLLETPRDTEDEITEIAARFPNQRVAIVTSAYHLPRTLSLCAKLGVEAHPCPGEYLIKPGADSGWKLLAWNIPSLDQSSRAIREYAGMLWLRLKG
jgi:uncharacterized SAM-binding protein YcdF (DUF218 family)